ncbi:RNA polymerase sigma-70 factor, ECF subfamily [Chitinophaga sp. CF118]|uniref:RNA polymerase sigma factor n=1 Tax=Chitinophaga sp. CF118 TaxID=1884367 RepID=UPI0008E9E615|nr:sigma-70 family RNA polymerase sigma factor [Chitinophaga sp. CF118]SFD45516.1 RNA polymerase sigma-70 factor, ECF subfamily [Chitinophaga sp. CF118]
MMKNLNDAELLSLVKKDDEKAFETLVYRYNVTLYKFIYARIREEHDTKDLLQEIFISFWKNRQNIITQDRILSYLTRAAYYAVIDWQIQHKKILARQTVLLEKDEPTAFPIEDQLISMELRNEVDSEVSKMNDTMRKVFVSSRWEAKSIREIAVEYGLSEQTVKNYISLALKRIRLKLNTDHWMLVYISLTLCSQFLNGTACMI